MTPALKSLDYFTPLKLEKVNLGKPQKKVLLLIAGPLRGGRGKGPAIKEKITFLKTFKKDLLPFKNKYFTLTYRNMDI